MLNDNTLHDEISFFGRTLIIDTSVFPNYHGVCGGPSVYETVAMYEDGYDLTTWTAHNYADALKNHREMLEKYESREKKRLAEEQYRQEHPLAGKYAKLRDDLLAAYAETEHLEQTEDGGTCNFDAPVLHLDRWDGNKIKQAAKEAGGSAFKWTWGGSVMGWVFSPRSSGQANRRSRRAEAISEALKAKGYNAGMYYAMD